MVQAMTLDLTGIIGIAAVAVMLLNLYLTISLGARVKGGMIGKRWRIMTALVMLFAAGYFSLPFLAAMPVESLRLVASLIFFFGAIYVLITQRQIPPHIKELMY
jgi:hypothetical protein